MCPAIIALLLFGSACALSTDTRGARERGAQQALDAADRLDGAQAKQAYAGEEVVGAGLPYSAFLFQLDMCVLAYQTWAQQLYWPSDPFYHHASTLAGHNDRRAFMTAVRAAAAARPLVDDVLPVASELYDPILYMNSATVARTRAINPTSPALVYGGNNAKSPAYRPVPFASKIERVMVQDFVDASAPHGLHAAPVDVPLPVPPGPPADDGMVLVVFHGKTGVLVDKARYPGVISPLGIAVGRRWVKSSKTRGWDAHITFRGSRSGLVGSAVKAALLPGAYTGNADWTTDLDDYAVPFHARIDRPVVFNAKRSTVTLVHSGFHAALTASMRSLLAALDALGTAMGGKPPARIWLSGHSLGGALATNLAARALLARRNVARKVDDDFFAGATAAVLAWPWKKLKLVTFSAPPVGNLKFAVNKLQPALSVTPSYGDARWPSLLPGSPASKYLHAANKPAFVRVLCELDPITQDTMGSFAQAGTTVYVSVKNWKPIGSTLWHEVFVVRDSVADRLARVLPPAVRHFQAMVPAPVCDGVVDEAAYRRVFAPIANVPAALARAVAVPATARAINAERTLGFTPRAVIGEWRSFSATPFQPDGAAADLSWGSDSVALVVGCNAAAGVRALAWQVGGEQRGYGVNPDVRHCKALPSLRATGCESFKNAADHEPCVCIRLNDVSHEGGSALQRPVATGTLWLRRRRALPDPVGSVKETIAGLRSLVEGVTCP